MPAIQWDRCLGAIETLSPWAVPDGYATSAINVDLSPHTLCKPRAGLSELSLTSGPSAGVYNLFTDRSSGAEVLWAFSSSGSGISAHRRVVATWFSVTLTDTPAINNFPEPCVTCCSHNGKVFIAYDNSQNRLHVYDVDGVLRRVGVVAPAAATVANTGAGTYAATLRYYKVQMRVYSAASVLQASSELSPSVSFTPSGAGTAARVTKPTTVDGSTHWVVYGSADNVTYYRISGAIAVGTTTHDDSFTPADYAAFGGGTAPEVGLFVPPPSVKFLATNGERIFMAGAYETSAGSGETTPNERRVWFTRPLGATDAGDDEAITQTADSRYYIDIDNEDGSVITGLCSTIDGSVYVGTSTSVWRLSDTGLVDQPIRKERVVSGVGPSTHYLMTVSDTVDGSMLYFGTADGPYRYSPSVGVQYLGSDWCMRSGGAGLVNRPALAACLWDPLTRRIYWIYNSTGNAFHKMRVLDPSLLSSIGGVWRGGWSLDSVYETTPPFLTSATVYKNRAYFGAIGDYTGSQSALIVYRDEDAADDGNGEVYTVTLASKSWVPHDGSQRVRSDEPYIWKRRDLSVSMVLSRNRGGTGNTVSDTAANESIAIGETSWHQLKVEGLVQADASSLELELGITAPVVNEESRHTDGVDRIVIPYTVMERG